jgi:hypothetical protein
MRRRPTRATPLVGLFHFSQSQTGITVQSLKDQIDDEWITPMNNPGNPFDISVILRTLGR